MAQEDDSDDPVTAEYDIYLTPTNPQSLYLLQFPNRAPNKPYTNPLPSTLRMKPKSGYIEMDLEMDTTKNFNKYQGLKWGENLPSSTDSTQGTGTYGLAGGLSSHYISSLNGGGRRGEDEVDRDNRILDGLQGFREKEDEGKVMKTQTLGGQVLQHDGLGDEAGKPIYFIGAFKGPQLHLTPVTGTAQLRPFFHHLDAEDTRARLNASTGENREPRGRVMHQSYKSGPLGGSGNPKGELEEQSAKLTMALRRAGEESWVPLKFVDEEEERAWEVFGERLFNREVGTERCRSLKAGMEAGEWVDGMSAMGKGKRKSKEEENG